MTLYWFKRNIKTDRLCIVCWTTTLRVIIKIPVSADSHGLAVVQHTIPDVLKNTM